VDKGYARGPDLGTERIFALMKERGIRSITEQSYRGDGKLRTIPASDYDRRGGIEWLADRVGEVMEWGRKK